MRLSVNDIATTDTPAYLRSQTASGCINCTARVVMKHTYQKRFNR